MRRLILGVLIFCAAAIFFLTFWCDYLLIEDQSTAVSVGQPTYKIESAE